MGDVMSNWTLDLFGYAFNALDVAIVALCFMGAVSAASRGFAMEFSSRSGLLIGAVVALMFSRSGAEFIAERFGLPPLWSTLISFVVFFVVGYLIMLALGAILDKTLDVLMLDWMDGLLGFALGIVEVLLVVSFLIYAAQSQGFYDVSAYVNPSVIYTQLLRPIAPRGIEIFKEVFYGR